ncbi:MAG: C4-dicarboxylate ABC transporter substrate-binding protein, partial [Gammaproteobacteria bacterium]
MKKINLCLASVAAVALAASVQAAELNMLSSWNTNYAGAKYTVPKFAEMVKERVPNLTVDVKGPEAVSPFEQLEPVQAGLYQFVYTHGGYHYGTTGIGMGMDGV